MSIWRDGELVVGQTRRRLSWALSALTPSGITGVTKISETCSDPVVDDVAVQAVKAVTTVPHGLYGVDMTYDRNGIPNPTEINISRFFTTVQFFAEAGLNMPRSSRTSSCTTSCPCLKRRTIRFLTDFCGRAMDAPPLLTTQEEIEYSLEKAW